jgi:hypothetical protein
MVGTGCAPVRHNPFIAVPRSAASVCRKKPATMQSAKIFHLWQLSVNVLFYSDINECPRVLSLY